MNPGRVQVNIKRKVPARKGRTRLEGTRKLSSSKYGKVLHYTLMKSTDEDEGRLEGRRGLPFTKKGGESAHRLGERNFVVKG